MVLHCLLMASLAHGAGLELIGVDASWETYAAKITLEDASDPMAEPPEPWDYKAELVEIRGLKDDKLAGGWVVSTDGDIPGDFDDAKRVAALTGKAGSLDGFSLPKASATSPDGAWTLKAVPEGPWELLEVKVASDADRLTFSVPGGNAGTSIEVDGETVWEDGEDPGPSVKLVLAGKTNTDVMQLHAATDDLMQSHMGSVRAFWRPNGAAVLLEVRHEYVGYGYASSVGKLTFLDVGGPRLQLLYSPGASQSSQDRAAQALQKAGHPPSALGEAKNAHPSSRVFAAKGFEDAARAVAAAVPGGARVEPLTWKPGYDIVVVIGSGECERAREVLSSEEAVTVEGAPCEVELDFDADGKSDHLALVLRDAKPGLKLTWGRGGTELWGAGRDPAIAAGDDEAGMGADPIGVSWGLIHWRPVSIRGGKMKVGLGGDVAAPTNAKGDGLLISGTDAAALVYWSGERFEWVHLGF